MKNISLQIYFLSVNLLMASGVVVPHDEDYFTYTKDNVEIIYTEKNLAYAKQTATVETPLNSDYKRYFDWELDETLYVGLISCNNQIANGFSSQWPYNRQINYIGGAMMVDYFSSVSWLHTLLYHESAHNYQVNVKGSGVSRALHSVFGNGNPIVPVTFIVPNVMENSFMLEGNAVLNESWHGNGGRLYSGRFKAETILQAKAGNLIASDLYNTKLAFPYGDIVYIQGAFFNLYLAELYGIEKVNSYFKIHSQDFWWPQFTNASLKEALGVDFEDALTDFATKYKELYRNFVEVKGEHLASSQFFNSLSNNKDEIFFITNESGIDTPELVVIEKKTLKIKKAKESWIAGKVIKTDGDYYTQASKHTSPIKIHQGLFCNQGFIKKGTASKIVHGYLSNNKEVYFDVNSSFSQPQLYVGDEFYDRVNSSVIIDIDDNLYYFKQDKKKRTLYRNKTPLYTYDGFYGIVSDVDSKGIVYFVANSELGSTLYSFDNGEVKRVSKADNIVEARLINDDELLIAAISEKDYYYTINPIEEIEQTPYETKLFFENEVYYGEYENLENKLQDYEHIDLSNDYYSFLDMHYSATNLGFGVSIENEPLGSLNIMFEDPLSQNAANVFVSKNESDITLAGVGYTNSQYLLSYTISAYGVVENKSENEIRDYGLSISSSLPLYQAGYLYASLGLSYFQDYATLEREPLSLTLTMMQIEQYGIGIYPNQFNFFQLYGISERGDAIVGANYKFSSHLVDELYLSLEGKYSYTNGVNTMGTKGVKLTNVSYENMDPSSISMPNLGGSAYVKEAGFLGIGLYKVFNFSSYFFTFPVSLQRESIYAKYRHYEIQGFSKTRYMANEYRIGTRLATVYLNSFTIPLDIEYIYNDAEFVQNKSSVQWSLGLNF